MSNRNKIVLASQKCSGGNKTGLHERHSPGGDPLRQGSGGRPLGDVKSGKEPGRDRPLGRVCHARETVSAKA